MISHLHGRLAEKTPTQIVVDVGGLGLAVEVPLTVSSRIGEPGDMVRLHTWLQVRDDDLRLYGFDSREERGAFLALMSIRGVGGRLALNVLSHLDLGQLTEAVRSGDLRPLLAVPGIGRKTAQRLLLELGGHFGPAGPGLGDAGRSAWPWPMGDPRRDAAQALVQLGYSPVQARDAVGGVPADGMEVDDLIRAALGANAPQP